MKVVISRSRVPSGGYWIYKDTETNVVIKHPYLGELEKRAKEHRVGNNLPVGSNWFEEFEQNICQQHPDLCDYKEPDLLTKAESLTRALRKWALSGFSVASDEIVQHRLAICEACEFWSPGRNLGLSRCRKCGCAGRAKIMMKTENCPISNW